MMSKKLERFYLICVKFHDPKGRGMTLCCNTASLQLNNCTPVPLADSELTVIMKKKASNIIILNSDSLG